MFCRSANIAQYSRHKYMLFLIEQNRHCARVFCTIVHSYTSSSYGMVMFNIPLNTLQVFFFFSYLGRNILPSHASAEACLTGWPNAQPQGRDQCSVAQHHQANLMVCVVCSCCMTSPYREVCIAKGGIGSSKTLCHDIYHARPITTVSLATNTYCMMDGHHGSQGPIQQCV